MKQEYFRYLKISFSISLFISILLGIILWNIFKPNKFDQSDVNRINEYIRKEHEKYLQEEREEKSKNKEAREFDKLHPELVEWQKKFIKETPNPFGNKTLISVNPAASIPSEYVYGFWDYCRDSDGDVFLNLSNVQSSFDSRNIYLKGRIFRISLPTFILLLIAIATYLFYRNISRKNNLKS